MPSLKDNGTTIGGNGVFHTTHWTEILEARSEDEPRRRAALENVLGRCWKPVYCYLRCKGYDRETAKDLTQGFFCEVVLGRRLVQRADRTKGRFRTFLLTALDRYVSSVHRTEKRKKRMPAGGLVPLKTIDWLAAPQSPHLTAPDQAFDYAWASETLDHVVAQLAGECRDTGNTTHWRVFQSRVLRPITENVEPSPISPLQEVWYTKQGYGVQHDCHGQAAVSVYSQAPR